MLFSIVVAVYMMVTALAVLTCMFCDCGIVSVLGCCMSVVCYFLSWLLSMCGLYGGGWVEPVV